MIKLNRLRDKLVEASVNDNENIVDSLLGVLDVLGDIDHRLTKQEKLMTKTVKKSKPDQCKECSGQACSVCSVPAAAQGVNK